MEPSSNKINSREDLDVIRGNKTIKQEKIRFRNSNPRLYRVDGVWPRPCSPFVACFLFVGSGSFFSVKSARSPISLSINGAFSWSSWRLIFNFAEKVCTSYTNRTHNSSSLSQDTWQEKQHSIAVEVEMKRTMIYFLVLQPLFQKSQLQQQQQRSLANKRLQENKYALMK